MTVAQAETGFDRVLGFTIPGRDARGRVVRLGPLLQTVLAAHDYPPAIRHLLAEALVLTALIGSLLKDEQGQLTMQAQTQSGVVDLLVCDYRGGEVRGYVRHDAERLGALGASPSLAALFGEGYLAITFDLASTGERYQGIVPLEGDLLAQACESYFAQSEQVPTLIRVAIRTDAQGSVGAGMLVQHLPDGEEGRERLHVQLDHPHWEHVKVLAGSLRHDEMVDADLSLETLIWRLFHDEGEVRVMSGAPLTRGCRCSADYYRSVLAKFGEEQLAEMRDDNEQVVVDCAFCSRLFEIAI